MRCDRLMDGYFNWLCDAVNGRLRTSATDDNISFDKLLMYLHGTEFEYSIPMDANRADDGIGLRYRFASENNIPDENIADTIYGPCSMLEMMVGLAIRCEESIMDDPAYGNRTGQWFWGMIVNLGLGSMTNSRFNRRQVDKAIRQFLDREYEPNGKGGLFTVRNCDEDLRKVEIWYQLCWYLDEIA